MPLTLRTACAAAAAVAATAATVVVGGTAAHASTSTSASCADGSGQRWRLSVVWGGHYVDAQGTKRVDVSRATWTTEAGELATEARVRTYDGTGTLVQDVRSSASFDYRSGATSFSRNPANPATGQVKTKVKLTLDMAGDDRAGCSVTFTQPTTASTASPSPTSSPSTPPATTSSNTYEADVLKLTNVERKERDLVAVKAQSCVDRYAERQAATMAEQKRMFHQELQPILDACKLSRVGENVAYGYANGEAVMDAWMKSPGHKANIVKKEYRLLGVGAAQDSDGRWYAAQVFGTLA